MAYTLVGAPALGFDLVRTPGGPNVAEVLLCALSADVTVLQSLANAHPGTCRVRCWADALAAAGTLPQMSAVLSTMPTELDLAATQPMATQELMTRLTEAPLGDLEALDRLIRREVLDWTWEVSDEVSLQRLRDRLAADVLVDAAASAYCATVLDDRQRRHLAAPFLSVVRGLPRPAPETADPVGRLLAGLSSWTEPDRADWRAAVDLLRSGTESWTMAMHDAGWAAHLSGRTRTAATDQLRAVLAFRSAGFTASDAAEGAWNALSGVVHALAVRDLLADEHVATLLRPWQIARGGIEGLAGF